MAKERTKKSKPLPIVTVPVEQELKDQLIAEADRDDRSLSDICRRLWREALAVRGGSRQELATAGK